MRTIASALMVAACLASSASASPSGLFYLEGENAGQPVKAATYIGYRKMCFSGSPMAARKTLWSLIDGDIEKAKAFVRYDKNRDTIYFGYVNTKCTDEGESEAACRNVYQVPKCQ